MKMVGPKGKGKLSREKIISVAITLFSKQGYDATSAQQIADECGVSQTNIFYHFGSKRKLFEHAVHWVIGHNREIISNIQQKSKTGAYEEFIGFIQGNVLWAHKYPNEFQMIMLLLYFSASSSKFKKLATEIFENAANILAQKIDGLKANRTITSEMSSLDLARIIQQYINGVQYQVCSRQDGSTVFKNYEKNLPYVLQSILHIDGV